jgi:hypothetical protein
MRAADAVAVAAAAWGLAAGCAGPATPAGEQAPATCSDGADNDADGLVDCDDPGCAPFYACRGGAENTPAACIDDVDNDLDGLTDCEDPACIGIPACAERGDVACDDGADNDLDGVIDCADPTCASAAPCAPPPTPEVCGNGLDDDGDGGADCMDSDCSGDPACTAAPALMPGDCTTHLFSATDPDTAALPASYGVTEAQLIATLEAAKPAYGSYDFSAWGCRWYAVDVMVPAGGASVNAFYTNAAEPRDYLVACVHLASGQLAGDDDEDGLSCSFFADCGPLLPLALEGRWTCLFSVSPFDVIGNGNSPVGGDLVACLNP